MDQAMTFTPRRTLNTIDEIIAAADATCERSHIPNGKRADGQFEHPEHGTIARHGIHLRIGGQAWNCHGIVVASRLYGAATIAP